MPKTNTSKKSLLVNPIKPREIEGHRVATSLELLYDLTFVVAIASLSHSFSQSLIHGEHLLKMFFIFMFIFCTIWWPWNNFTWFSNGYDTEDMQFKFASFVQMIGVSTIAASINNAFHDNNFTLMSIGFVIMRIPQILLWFKVAYDDKSSRELALRS